MLILKLKEQYLCRWQRKVPDTKKGSISIIALWALFFLSALALVINVYVMPQLKFAAKLKSRAKAYSLACAGVKKAIAVMANDETLTYDTLGELQDKNEKELKGIALGDGVFSVVSPINVNSTIKYGFVDEESKININKASYDVLKRFFELTASLTPEQADAISVSILDWREPGDVARATGAKSGYYQSLSPGYDCKNKDFEVLEELLLVKGMDGDIFNKVCGWLTVYGQGTVNINTADKIVLQSLGFSGGLTEKIVNFRSTGAEEATEKNSFLAVDQIASSLQQAGALAQEESAEIAIIVGQGVISVGSDNFRAASIGKVSDTSDAMRIDFVFDRKKTIKSWREKWE